MTHQEIEERYDYRFNAIAYENRIQHLIDWQWAEFAEHGHITATNYVFAVSYE